MKAVVIIFTAAAVLAACFMGSRARDQEQANRVQLATIDAKRNDALPELAQLQARLDTAQQRQSALQKEIARLQATRPGPGTPPPTLDLGSPGAMEKLTAMLDRTRRQDASSVLQYVANGTYRATALYAGFFREVKFTPEQEDEFIRRYFDAEGQIADLKLLVLKRLIAPNDPIVTQLIAKIERERETALDTLLQPLGSSYRQFADQYVGADGVIEAARSMVAGVAGVAVLASEPFTEPQLAELAAIVRQHMSIPPHAFAASYTTTVDWPQVDAAAREILSDAQWRIFTQVPGTNGRGAYGGGRFDNNLYRAIEDATRSEKGKQPRSE